MGNRQIVLAGLLLVMAVLGQGCMLAVVGAGAAGTVAYIKGDLEAVESKDIDAVYAATKEAMRELGLTVTEDSKDALAAEIVARDAENKKITIILKATPAKTTEVSIRVGMFGNETKSRMIYDKIKGNL